MNKLNQAAGLSWDPETLEQIGEQNINPPQKNIVFTLPYIILIIKMTVHYGYIVEAGIWEDKFKKCSKIKMKI